MLHWSWLIAAFLAGMTVVMLVAAELVGACASSADTENPTPEKEGQGDG